MSTAYQSGSIVRLKNNSSERTLHKILNSKSKIKNGRKRNPLDVTESNGRGGSYTALD